jgi:hypothetical protein
MRLPKEYQVQGIHRAIRRRGIKNRSPWARTPSVRGRKCTRESIGFALAIERRCRGLDIYPFVRIDRLRAVNDLNCQTIAALALHRLPHQQWTALAWFEIDSLGRILRGFSYLCIAVDVQQPARERSFLTACPPRHAEEKDCAQGAKDQTSRDTPQVAPEQIALHCVPRQARCPIPTD